jgi:hypothetical protein
MPLKTALKYLEYSLAIPPIKTQMMFPGNIGEGIRIEAAKKIEKKAIRIHIPFMFLVLSCIFCLIQKFMKH